MLTASRDELQSVLGYLQQQVGDRQPGSAAEATAAAYVNARLRRAGTRVGTQAVSVPHHPQRTAAAIFALAVLAALLAPWLPIPGLLLAVWALCALIFDRLIAALPALGGRLESQNVFGTRAIAHDQRGGALAPRWRVVVLARLDTPPAPVGLQHLLAPTRTGALARLLGPCLALAAAIAALVAPGFAWLFATIAGAYLILLIGVALQRPTRLPQPDVTPALAALVPTLGRLTNLRRVELWGVALGAVANGESSAVTLLRNFPFEPACTFIIGIEDLAGAQLAYATREGAFIGRPTKPQLLRLADAADAADTTIDAEPRPFRADNGLTAAFRRRGFHTLTVFGAPGNGAPAVDGALLAEQAVRLVTGIVEQLEREEPIADGR
jgi:hypothetical protein